MEESSASSSETTSQKPLRYAQVRQALQDPDSNLFINHPDKYQIFQEVSDEYWQRHDFMVHTIAGNSKVNKAKPMVYYSAGKDILTFLGTDVSEAYFIDPGYNNLDWAYKESLLVDAKALDPTAIYTSNSPEIGLPETIIGFIEFHNEQGEKRRIYLDTHSADDGYLPNAVKEQGCSVFAAIGDSLQREKAPIEADAYVISGVLAPVLGYEPVDSLNDYIQVAFDYHQTDIPKDQLEIINRYNSMFLTDVFNAIVENYDIKQLSHFLGYIINAVPVKQLLSLQDLEGSLADAVIKIFLVKFRKSDLDALNPPYRRELVRIIQSVLEKKTQHVTDQRQIEAKNKLIQVIDDLMDPTTAKYLDDLQTK